MYGPITVFLFVLAMVISFINGWTHYKAKSKIMACAWTILGIVQAIIISLYTVDVLPIKVF